MEQSKFKEGDLVDWKDAMLTGKVIEVSSNSVQVEFKTYVGPKVYAFELDGRIWCWARKPQLTFAMRKIK